LPPTQATVANSCNSTRQKIDERYYLSSQGPLLKKAVFCVDNSITIDDMQEFVTGLSIQVLSLFETKTRRRQRQDSAFIEDDCKAFRLCINVDHRWPGYVSISDWFFKSAQTTNAASNQELVPRNNNLAATVAANSVDELSIINDDADDTIIMADHSQDASSSDIH
jgi:hypothetical protein